MPVAAIAMIATPAYLMNGSAASTARTRQVHPGVCSLGETRASDPETGSWLSRAMPKQSRIVAARIDRQQTKIAAETTKRYRVAKPVEKLASMTWAGFQPRPDVAVCRFGIATSVPSRKTPPITNAPITEYRTALGAARRGFLVSSASVAAGAHPVSET